MITRITTPGVLGNFFSIANSPLCYGSSILPILDMQKRRNTLFEELQASLATCLRESHVLMLGIYPIHRPLECNAIKLTCNTQKKCDSRSLRYIVYATIGDHFSSWKWHIVAYYERLGTRRC
jgi:hypothetical protein